MAIVLPVFEVREKLTAEKMNAFRDAVEAKFAGGITPADWSWPFVVQGNIDFAGTYGIVSLKTFWNLINAQEYINAGGSLQSAIDAAQTAGGGCVVIPPDTTIETNGVNITGSLTTIMGFGHSSVLKLSSGSSSGYFFRNATGGMTDIAILNVAFDGQNTGTGQAGVIIRRVSRFIMDTVYMKNFSGFAIQITHDGTPGNSCSDVVLRNVVCTGGTSASATHLKVEDCDGLTLSKFNSKSCPASAILMEPTGAAGILRDMTIEGVRVQSPTGKGISILGASATADAKWSQFSINNCRVRGNSDDAYEFGETNKILQHLDASDCIAITSGADAFVVNVQHGSLSTCRGHDATGDGIDLVSSESVYVNSCMLWSAGAYGIDASGTTNCTLSNNDVSAAVTQGILATTATGLRLHNNQGYLSPTGASAYSDFTLSSLTGTGNFSVTKLVPANTVRPGDVMRVTAFFTGGTATTTVRLATVSGASFGGGNTDASDNEFVWTCKIRTSADNTQVLIRQVREAATVAVATQSPAIDWTVDQTLRFECTAYGGGTVSLNAFFLEFMGSA